MNSNLIFTVSLWEVLMIILILISIGAVYYLLICFKNLAQLSKNASNLLEKNKEELDASIKSLPAISNQLEEGMDKLNKLLDNSSDDISKSIGELRQGLEHVNRLSQDAADTVEYVSTTAIDAADLFSDSLFRGSSNIEKIYEAIKRISKLFIR